MENILKDIGEKKETQEMDILLGEIEAMEGISTDSASAVRGICEHSPAYKNSSSNELKWMKPFGGIIHSFFNRTLWEIAIREECEEHSWPHPRIDDKKAREPGFKK